ncbi:MAG: siderophore-interacting protein [Acidimicrobiia bacterium]|nr:MAG: siderophore-interacting protein [Acidimicrobiia bacterium]
MARPHPVPITVTFTQDLTRRARRITFTGMTLVDSVKPAAYLSLYFDAPGPEWPPQPGAMQPPDRMYTSRYLDPACESITIDFVLHGRGKATDWARTAVAGDTIWAGQTTGGYDIPDSLDHLVLVGDDTAIPAIGTVLEAIPETTRTTIVIEVVDEVDERQPSDTTPSDPIWLHRGTDVATAGYQTMNLVRSIAVPRDAYWWIAGEREAIRSIRDMLISEKSVDTTRISLNTYWRLLASDPSKR